MNIKQKILELLNKKESSSILLDDEIAIISIMETLAKKDPFFKDLFETLVENLLELKKSKEGFGLKSLIEISSPIPKSPSVHYYVVREKKEEKEKEEGGPRLI